MPPGIAPIVVLQQSQGIVNTRPLRRETYCTHLRAMGEIFMAMVLVNIIAVLALFLKVEKPGKTNMIQSEPGNQHGITCAILISSFFMANN